MENTNTPTVTSDQDNKSISTLAVKKITSEANTVSGQNVPSIAIFKFLTEKCSNDEEFSAKVVVESKTLSKCFAYITEVAYRRASQQVTTPGAGQTACIGMSSDEIFALATEYFVLSDEEIERRKKAEEEAAEKRRIEQAAAAAQKRKEDAEKEKAKKGKEKKGKKAADPAPEKEAATEESQFSLFGSPEGGK